MKKSAKWFIVIVILIIISVVLAIVFINLFKDKKTDKLAAKVHTVATEGYLNESTTENERMNDYLDILLSVKGKVQTTENKINFSVVTNYKNALTAFENAIKFFDEKMIFSSYSDEYKNNHKTVLNAFDKAQKNANEISQYYNTNIPNTQNSDQQWTVWTERTWNTCKDYFEELISSTSEAFSKLFVIYQGSLNSKIMANDFTYIIFREATDKLTQLSQNPDNVLEGQNLKSFFGNYFSEEGEKAIINYNFDTSLQEKVLDIKDKNKDSQYYNEFLYRFSAN